MHLSRGEGIRKRNDICWCTCDGKPPSLAIQKPLSIISDVKSGALKLSAEDIAFQDMDFFIAGEIYHHYEAWETILHDSHKRDEILKYISGGVSVFDFFRHFEGQVKGRNYNSPLPPKMISENNKNCRSHEDFISATILERIANGFLSIWGKVGECDPPHLVKLITVEH